MTHVVTVVVVSSVFVSLAASTTVTESVLSHFSEYAPVLRLLPRYQGQNSDPDLGRHRTIVDVAAIRRAAELVPDDALYFVQAPEPVAETVRRVARLYFLPSVEVRRPTDADWILAFWSRSPPDGVADLESIALAPDLRLIRVARG